MSSYVSDYSIKWAKEYHRQYIQAIDECLIRLVEQTIENGV